MDQNVWSHSRCQHRAYGLLACAFQPFCRRAGSGLLLPSWLEIAIKVSELFLRMNSVDCGSCRQPAELEHAASPRIIPPLTHLFAREPAGILPGLDAPPGANDLGLEIPPGTRVHDCWTGWRVVSARLPARKDGLFEATGSLQCLRYAAGLQFGQQERVVDVGSAEPEFVHKASERLNGGQ